MKVLSFYIYMKLNFLKALSIQRNKKPFYTFYIPPLEKVRGIALYHQKKIAFKCPSVCLSVRPSVRLSVRQRFVSGLYLEHLLTNFLQTVCRSSSGLGLKMGEFRQISTDLWPLIYVKISFPGSILSIY